MLDEEKRTWAEISLSAIEQNYRAMREKLPACCRFLGVVKANAYGHGDLRVAQLMQSCGADYLAVACLDEAESLRKNGINLPILILGGTQAQFAPRVADCGATQTIGSLEQAEAFSAELVRAGKTMKAHIKLETGMGRTGFNVKKGDVSAAVSALKLKNLDFEGVFTHFAVSDEPDGADYTGTQLECFAKAAERIEKEADHVFKIKHCANSGAMVSYPEAYMDMVRPGIALYGEYSGAEEKGLLLTPAMELKSRIIDIHEIDAGESVSYGRTFTAEKHMRVAVLPIGYADGLHRALSGKLEVLIGGRRCRQLGRICMDMCMVDVTDVPAANAGDVATIFGRDGDGVISVSELAEKAGTISYELLSGISPRVPRVYK